MTKQHFEAFAVIIRGMRAAAAAARKAGQVAEAECWESKANGAETAVTVVARQFNRAFDGKRFSQACQPQ